MIFIGVPKKSGPSCAANSSTHDIPTVTQQVNKQARQGLEEGSLPNSLLTSTAQQAINR